MRLSAGELHSGAVEAANARRFARARRMLTTASSRTDDPDLRARIDGTTAYILDQTGQHSAAEELLQRLLASQGLTTSTVALLRGQFGTLLMHAGQLDEAYEMLSQAIEAIGDGTAELANCLMSRSMVSMQRHRLEACVADLNRAVAVYEANDDRESLAEARHNLGYAALLGGDLVKALALMTSSRPTLATASDLAAAISDLDRAEVLRDAGLTTEAEKLLGEVAVQFGAQRMRQARGEAEFHLARSLLRHDAASAERAAVTAARRFTALGSSGWAARAEAVRLQARLRHRLHAKPSSDELRRVSSALTRGGFRTEATSLTLAARLGDRVRMPRISADAPISLQLQAHEVRAVRANADRRDTAARRSAAAGLDLLNSWLQSSGALDLQASAAMHGSALMFAGLTSAARSRDATVLFEWSERARHLSQQVPPLRPPHDTDLASDLAELRMLRADLAGSDWTADARVRTLRNRVRDRQWSATGSSRSLDRLDLSTASRLLDPDTAALSYVFTGTEMYCLVVTASDAVITELSWPRVQAGLDGLRADLDVAALTRGGPMAAVIARSLDRRLRRLDAELLAPARALTGATRLALTVPGSLAGIPWGMLPSMHATPFTLATSVSRWLSERPTAATPAQRKVGFAAGPQVPRAVEEVRTAASAWTDAATLTGDDAQVSSVTALADRVDLLHIAAHGRHTVDNPLFSGFELADGVLFGYDVDLIPHVPETVVLSACELGRSSVRWGEEALGMTRVWLHAGTRSVIAAPVVVPDDVAGELLSAVHTGLAAGDPPSVALAAASESTGHRTPFQVHGSGF